MPGLLQRVFDPPPDWQTQVLGVIPALVVAWLAARLVRRLAARGLRTLLGDTITTESPAVRGPLRLIWAGAFVLVFALVIVPILEVAGLRPRTGVRLRTLERRRTTSRRRRGMSRRRSGEAAGAGRGDGRQ